MATQPNLTTLIERFFQEYANSSEIDKILVDPNEPISQPNQLITKQYALDNHAAAGAVGPTGPIGHTGLKGDPGANGKDGLQGATGIQGAHGTGVNILGSVANAAALPATGNTIADMHITRNDGHGHMWDSTHWIDVGRMQGPAGAQGVIGSTGPTGGKGDKGDVGLTGGIGHDGLQGHKGDTGAEGPAGAEGKHGTGVNILGTKPRHTDLDASYTGATGDMFIMIDTGHGFMWEGAQGWIDAGPIRGPDGLRGPKGDVGDQGPKGDDGNIGGIGHAGQRGLTGRDGPEGPRGADGQHGANGTSVIMKGTKNSPSDLLANYGGDIGDMYIIKHSDTEPKSGHGYMWEGPAGWVDAGKLEGPLGPQGIRGLQGNTGGVGGIGPQGKVGPDGPRGAPGYTRHSQFTDRNAVNSHPYTAISDIHRVFDDRLLGFNVASHHDILKGNIDHLRKDSVYIVSKTGGTTGTMPHGISVAYSTGIIVTYVLDNKTGEQIMYGRGADTGKKWTRSLTSATALTAWVGHNISSGTATPTGGDSGDLYIQHS